MKNKKIYVRIVIGIIAVALIATGILVFNSIKKERERVALAISEQSNYINSEVEIFNTRTNYNDQYLDFDTILTEYEAYKNWKGNRKLDNIFKGNVFELNRS